MAILSTVSKLFTHVLISKMPPITRYCVNIRPCQSPKPAELRPKTRFNSFSESFKTLNKVGHTLPMEPGSFQDVVTSDRTKKLLKALGYDQVSIPPKIRSDLVL